MCVAREVNTQHKFCVHIKIRGVRRGCVDRWQVTKQIPYWLVIRSCSSVVPNRGLAELI